MFGGRFTNGNISKNSTRFGEPVFRFEVCRVTILLIAAIHSVTRATTEGAYKLVITLRGRTQYLNVASWRSRDLECRRLDGRREWNRSLTILLVKEIIHLRESRQSLLH